MLTESTECHKYVIVIPDSFYKLVRAVTLNYIT